MAQQKISTPSVIDIRDEVILSTGAYGVPAPHLNIQARDEWNVVLSKVDLFALDPTTLVPSMDASELPSASNFFITRSFLERRLGIRDFALIGPPGSGADFEGTDENVFITALADPRPVLMVLPGSYLFANPVPVPAGKRIEGVHPLVTQIVSTQDSPVFVLVGEGAELKSLTIAAPFLATAPAVALSAPKSSIKYCAIVNFKFLAIQVIGVRAYVVSCYINGNEAAGVFLQGPQQRILTSVFAGQLQDGAMRVESNEGGAHSCDFSSTLTGFSFLVPSPVIHDVRIIGNNFASAVSLAASEDLGTGTIRYGNTPNNLVANVNNFLFPLAQFTGQPTITSNVAVTATQFTYGPAADTELTELLGALDYAIQNNYEERNFFLTSSDPVFDSLGAPSSGVFSWDGTTRTITWPNFELRSTIHKAGHWTIAAGNATLQSGEVLIVDVDRSISGSNIALTPVVMTDPMQLLYPIDAQRLVLCVGLPTVFAVWTSGFRLLSAMTSFDVDGWPLPLTRYIGVTETRNPAPPYSGFSGAAESSLTDKLSALDQHSRLLYERSNLVYDPSSTDAFWSSDPEPGDYYDSAVLQNGLSGVLTHALQLGGTTYALIPDQGVFRFQRDSGGWGALSVPPIAGPYCAMGRFGTGLMLVVAATGEVLTWEPLSMSWAITSPVVASTISLPMTSVVPTANTYYDAGVSDFSVQTDSISVLRTVDGLTLFYSSKDNALWQPPSGAKVFGFNPVLKSIISHAGKDTGFSAQMSFENANTLTGQTGAPGAFFSGLPLAQNAAAIEVVRSANFLGINSINWESLEVIQFSMSDSKTYMIVARENSGDYHFFSGGIGTAKYLGRWEVGGLELSFMRPDAFALDVGNSKIIAVGTTPTGSFAQIIGSFTDANTYSWTSQSLSVAGSSAGVIAIQDPLTGDTHALVSNPARGNRPTWWRRDHSTGNWSSAVLTETFSVAGDFVVAAAVANSFQYAGTDLDPMAGTGSASSTSISFLVKDNARTARPTLFRYIRASATYSAIRLTNAGVDVVLPQADASSYVHAIGASYNPLFAAHHFVVRPTTAGQIRVFTYFEVTNTWASVALGTGGTALSTTAFTAYPFNNRASQKVSVQLSADSVFIWTPNGLVKGVFTGGQTGPFVTQTWTIVSTKMPVPASAFPLFSSSLTSAQIYSIRIGTDRAGEMSYQLFSAVDPSLPLYGAGSTQNNSQYMTNGISWLDLGTKVRQYSDSIWVGINRAGYLWAANSAVTSEMMEFSPNFATVRGTILVPNLGIAGDYDAALAPGGTLIGIVFRDQSNLNRLAFMTYNFLTNAVTLERSGFSPFITTGDVALGSRPRVIYNTFLNTWDVVAQDDSRAGGQIVFFRRPLSSPAWLSERVGSGGDKPLVSMIAQAGKKPSAPFVTPTGDVFITTENGVNQNALLVCRLQSTSTWTTIFQTSTGGGFAEPEYCATDSGYWIFGGQNLAGNASVAFSSTISSGYSVQSSIPVAYSRSIKPVVQPISGGAIVYSILSADGLVPSNRELGCFQFSNASPNTAIVNAWTAQGRLSQGSDLSSGEEEDSLADLSITHVPGMCMYGALRPTRTALHWTRRGIDSNASQATGDSLSGPGRSVTLGTSIYREQWTGDSIEPTVFEFSQFGNPEARNWGDNLPLAQRNGNDDFLSMRWPGASDPAATSLFTIGSPPQTFAPETALSDGQWPTPASLRKWPRITGSGTYLSGISPQGSALLTPGAMLQFEPPTGETLNDYVGSTSIGPAGQLLKITAVPTLTLLGTHSFKAPTDAARTYTIVGPLKFVLDPLTAVGQHLVLNFSAPSTLMLDASANPLSYWQDLNASVVDYPLVLGETREQEFMLYPIVSVGGVRPTLTHGNIEPRELADPDKAKFQTSMSGGLKITIGATQSIPISFVYEILPITGSTASIREVGTGLGLQLMPPPQLSSAAWTLVLRRNMQVAGGSFVSYRSEIKSTSEGLSSTIATSPSGTFIAY